MSQRRAAIKAATINRKAAHYLTGGESHRKEVEMTSQDKQQYKKLMSYSKSQLIAIIKNDDYIIADLNKKLKEAR